MFNVRNLSRGTIVAGLTVLGMLATVAGKPQLAAFLGSAETADLLQAAIVGFGTLAAGLMEGFSAKAEKVAASK